MPRKKTSSAPATSQTSPSNGAAVKHGAKTAAVRELYAKGVKSAAEISAELDRRGLSVSMPVIYKALNKLKRGGRRKNGRKQKAKEAVPAGSAAPAPASSRGLTVDDLGQLAAISKK